MTLVPERCGGRAPDVGHGKTLGGNASVVVFESPPSTDVVNSHPSQSDGDIALINVQTGEVRRLTRGAPAYLGFPSPIGPELLWEETLTEPEAVKFRCRRHLHCIDASGSDSLIWSWADHNWHQHPPRWSPDGTRFAVAAEGQVLVWSIADTTAPPTRPALPDGVSVDDGFLLWTAEGDGILIRSGGSLWKLPIGDAAGPARSWSVPGWAIQGVLHQSARGSLPSGDLTVFAEDESTQHQGLYRLHADGADPLLLEEGPREYAGIPFAALGTFTADVTPNGERFVYAIRDGERPGETLWLASSGGDERRPLVDLNPHLMGKIFGVRKSFRFRTNDGEEVGARILLPPGWTPGRHCPTVVSVYPGAWPSQRPYSFDDGDLISHQFLAARGFAVLQPDVPYDETAPYDPSRACDGAVLPALNEAVRLGYVDNERVALEGASFGGYGVVTLLCNTGRFRAAIAVAPPTDLASMYGGMPDALSPRGYRQSIRSTFGASWLEDGDAGMRAPVWDRPLRYVINSPVFWLDRISTPLLLIAGSADAIVPWSQAAEVFIGLRRLGRRCMLLVYKGEEHGEWSLPSQRDLSTRVVDWLDEYLGSAG